MKLTGLTALLPLLDGRGSADVDKARWLLVLGYALMALAIWIIEANT